MTSRTVPNFGSIIKENRLIKKMTLTQLAAKLNLDSANLSKIENGIREFDEKRLPELAEILELDLNEIRAELLSEKIAKKIVGYDNTTDILYLAETKVKYLKKGRN